MKIRYLILLGVIAATGAVAQDPPSRVARLNWFIGNVSFQPAGIDSWTAASLNYPLTTGDHLYTDTGSRAELHVGPNAIRLNGETSFGFLNLDDRTVQGRFTEGSMEIRLRRLEDDDLYEVDTPQGAVSLLRTGDYRIDTDPSRNATMVTVWSGQAEVFTGGKSFIIHLHQTGYFPEGADPDIREANPADDFDQFTADRNRRDDRVPPPVHVSQSMVGYEDLDEYGSWSDTPDYGWVWAPRVVAGWVPYHQGRWVWVEPWGWTWVDEAPWGFAPFHYGRWAYLRASWVWVPGAITPHPVYAPALVAFVGGPRFTIALGVGAGGAIGWFPLGPREPFYPAYRVSNTYLRQVNVTHVTNVNIINNTNVTNIRYVNERVPGAVMAMPQQGFVSSRAVRETGLRVQPQHLAQAEVVGTAPPVPPLRESVLGGQINRNVRVPTQPVMTRPVVARTAPPPPPVSFQARQQLIQQNNGRPLTPEQVIQLRRQPGAVVNRQPIRTAGAPPVRPVERVAPQPGAQPPVLRPQPEGPVARPAEGPVVRPPERPVVRPPESMDTRPPSVRPTAPAQTAPLPPQQRVPAQRPSVPQIESRPQPEPPEARPQPGYRPQPPMRPPEVRQPEIRQPQTRQPAPPQSVPGQPAPRQPERVQQPDARRGDAPVREQRTEPSPRREERQAPVRERQEPGRTDSKRDDKDKK